MSTVAELIDRGIKAYLAGRVKDALASFQRVLELEPGNAKARGYIVRIHAVTPATTPVPGYTRSPPPGMPARAVPLPGPNTAIAVPLPRGIVSPVPLPGAAPAPRAPRAPTSAPPEFAPSPWDEGPAAVATYVLEPGGGLDLGAVAERAPARAAPVEAPADGASEVSSWLGAARELFSLGDFTGSLELVEKVLAADPEHVEARAYLRQNEATLVSMYESKLGPLSGVPRLAIKPEEILWLNLDHRAGFLLSQIDGAVDYEALFALSGLPRLDTAKILANLVADGVIRA